MKTIITWLKRAAMLSVTVAFAAAGLGANAATSLTLNDGDTLTGVYEDYEITIASGATVTFNNATVTRASDNAAVVQTLGDATIILAEGSENSVAHTQTSGYAGAGISSAAGHTLTIDGTGSLVVQGGSGAAGIGANANTGSRCGNIVIADGTIVATGGEGASAIGAGYYESKCGDITIAGGNVTAKALANTGSYYPPAIGAGFVRSSCGNILICGGTVTADASDPNCDYSYDMGPAIGASASNCGSITIVDGVERIVATKGAKAQEIIGKGCSDYTSVGKISRLLRFNKEYSNNDNTLTLTPGSDFETYTVTWKNDDGTTADTTSVEYGLLPSHAGLTKAGDGYIEYLFAGWTPEFAEVESNVTYTAVFCAVPAVRSTGGAAEWFPDAGERALRSGAIEGNQNTWLQTTLSRPCVLSFKWKTSSEANCDPLVFYVDGVEHSRISGESADWSVVTLSFEDSKNHVLRWVYSKDGGVNGKYDCGWIRDFVVTPLDSWAVTRELNYEGAAEIETRYVKKGRQLDVSEFPPLDGLREGYTCYWALAPWSSDALTNAVDISADTTLYARWIKQHGFDEIDTTCQEPWTWLEDGSIRTGKIGDSGNTWATISVTGPCDVSFKWKSSSENGWDKLHFYVDADHKTDISGAQADWATYSASVDSGEHVLKWTYTKDGNGSVGEDCGWIKDVVITAPGSAPYTVMWKNADGTTLETDADLEAGAVPVYNSALPTLAATAQYTYEFAGWEPEFELVSSNTTYTAKYTATLRSYDVTWQNEGGTELATETLCYGTTPTYSGATPVKPATPKFTYTFAGWDPEVATVTGEATYTATYDATINEYTITWKNEDGTTLDSESVEYDETPTHADPAKASTAQYHYEFAGWSPAVVSVTGEATYTATFTPILRSYTITWLNEDGTALDTSTVEYGATPSHAAPTKASTAQYDYTFAGWGNVVAVTGEATYQATFTPVLRSYTITWVSEGATVASGLVAYGTTPAYGGATPVKESTAEYDYTFAGWGNVVAVTGAATYTAQFNATKRSYTITWANIDGEGASATSTVEYGTTPTYGGDTPAKASTAEYSYEFTGWSPTVSTVTGEATYTAQFSQTKRSYTITWVVEDATVASGAVEYGQTPAYDGDTPTKESTAEYSYTFTGWSPAIAAVTGEATYTAQFSQTKRSYTVSWVVEGETVASGAVEYGATPTYTGATPTKAETDEYTYEFAGWSPAVASVTGNATYTATFNAMPKGEGGTIDVSTLAKGDVIQGGSVLMGTAQNLYLKIADGATITLDGASITSSEYYVGAIHCLGDATIILAPGSTNTVVGTVGRYCTGNAIYVPTNSTLTIRGSGSLYADSSSSEFRSAAIGAFADPYNSDYVFPCGDIVIEGGTIVVNGGVGIGASGNGGYCGNITITGDANVTATATVNGSAGIGAAGSDGNCGNITISGNASVTATGKYNGPGIGAAEHSTCGDIVIATTGTVTATGHYYAPGIGACGAYEECKCGNITIADTITEVVAQGQNDALGIYTTSPSVFTYGSHLELVTSDENRCYTLTPLDVPETVTVTWKNEDGTTLETDTVAYGATPTYDGETPTKAEDAQYTYTFDGWIPAVVAATSNTTYTATFNSTKRSYTVAWVVEGVTVASGAVEYGTTPTYGGETPTKESTAEYSYEFTGWSPTVATVTGAATYTAQFSQTKRSYMVSWVVEGVTVASGSVEYGTTPVYNGATPTKPEDENYTYTFNGWTPAVVAVIGNATYTATFTATPKETEDPEEPYEGTETIDGIAWSYTVENGEATITGAQFAEGAIAIPETVHDGVPVMAIEEGVFADNQDITEVTISRYVRRIGADVGVKSADWAQNLEEIGFDGSYPAFGNCESLMDYRVDANNEVFEEIGGALYYRNTPANAKELALYPSGRDTLYFANGLTVTKIGDGACAWCHKFTELTIPASVRAIGVRSFDFCREIVTLTIPATVTDIGWGAFLMNIALENADINGTDLAIGDYAFYHSFMADNAGNLVIRGGVKEIGFNAFCNSMHLGSVVIEDGVTNIAMNAFSQCYDLSTVTLPDTLTAIGAGAFCGCSELREIIVPLSVDEIGLSQQDDGSDGGAFAGCYALARIYLPLSLKPATVEEANDYLANVFNGLGLEDMSAAEIAEILTWYSDPNEIGGGDEPEEPTELPDYVTTGGDAEWFVDTDGSWRSGTIMNSQETWIETTVTGPCLVTFSWKASSEGGGYDMLALAVDGEEKDSIGGVMSDWVEYSLPIPESGAHTVRWTYSKDGSAWDGEDCGWVKNFTETPKTFTSYTVTWKNWDGTVLGEDSVVEGFMPQYRGETPARATDEDYYYTFAGWTPVVASVTGDTIYTATYNAYQARFEMVMDGTTVTGYIGLVPKHITLADWPEGVTAIADDVFSGYSHVGTYTLESVEIPATVQTIGQRAFYSSYGLTNLVFEAGGTQPLEIGFAAFSFAYALESVTLPERLASIADSGFYQCDKLAEVTFLGGRENVTIGRSAFKGTPYYSMLPFKMILMEIDGQQKVVSYQGTLPEVISLADWPAEATAIAGGSLGWNSIVKDITIPSTITSVDAQAFYSSYELTNVVFAVAAPGVDPAPLAIEESAFGECGKLRSVTLRDGLARIAGYAFSGCPLLAEVNFPPSGTDGAYIADSAFAGTEYESHLPFKFYVDESNIVTGFRGECPANIGGEGGVPWPDNISGIGSDAFSGCTTLVHVTFPAGIEAVALGAFRGCGNLASVNFANCFATLTAIGGESFSGCTSLETVELDGDGLYIDSSAFESCTSLTTLTLGSGVSKVDEFAFAYSTSLAAFVNNSSAVIDETAFLGTAYNKNQPFSFITKRQWGELVLAGYRGECPAQITADMWPAGVTYVNRKSFTFCDTLRAVEFPANIGYIDESAFACCTNLASITFPEEGSLHVGHNAFALCTKLQNVTLKSGMEVENDAFGGCASLETVIVEEGVRTIGPGAFARTLVRSIVLPEGIDWVDNMSFAGNDGDFTLYIPRNADDGNYGVSDGTVEYEYYPLIFGLETEEGWARYGLVVRATTANLHVVPYCRVTLDLAGGTGVATSQLGTGETVNDQFPHPVKAGFAFAGWTSARVAEITNDTTWTAIIGSATGMEATLTALWTPNETPEPPEIVVEDQELKDKLDDPVVDEDTGIRTIKPKDDQTTLTQEDADKIEIVSPLDGVTRITGAYVRTCSWQINEIVISLATPKVEPVVMEENKDEEDATGLLEDVDKVDDGKIAAMPEPNVSDPDPEKHEEVGALPVKMYPGLYYQASWGDDLNNLTAGAKFRADGSQTHIGVIKQTGSRGFYKISVSEK